LSTISQKIKGLVFKGGTALYKFYNLNRFSEDLDFTHTGKKLDSKKLRDQVIRSCSYLGINGRSGEIEKHQKEVNLSLFFNGPLYDGRKGSITRVSFNISLRERPQYKENRLCISPFNEIPSFELTVLREDEILAEKVRAVLTRDKPRDIYDMWFLLKRGVKLDKALINRKLKIYKLKYQKKSVIKRIEQMKGGWKKDLRALIIGNLPAFDDISKEIQVLMKV
jgi:predicted nucleotidyltransferase component of viral defense system